MLILMTLDSVPPYAGGGPRIVGQEYISDENICMFPNVSRCASGAHLEFDANSNSTFTFLRLNGAKLPH